jgi:uncharacterized RDD family membrane protein YckC
MSELVDPPEWFVSTAPGVVDGPLSAGRLRELAATGRLRPTDAVRHQTWSAWFPATDVSKTVGIAAFGSAAPDANPSQAAIRIAEPPQSPASYDSSLPSPLSAVAPADSLANIDLLRAAAITAPQRFTSWAIDAAILCLGALFVNAVLPNVVTAVVMFAGYAAYTVLLPMKSRATVGHIVMGFRVQPIEGTKVDPIALATRYSIVLLLSVPCLAGTLLSAISMTAHARAQAWHDVASGTTLVRVKPFQFGHISIEAASR